MKEGGVYVCTGITGERQQVFDQKLYGGVKAAVNVIEYGREINDGKKEGDRLSSEERDISTLYPDPYCVVNNCLGMKVYRSGKAEPDIKPLCNFVPYITAQIKSDDGTAVTTRAKIGGIYADGSPLDVVDVSDSEFASMNWITKNWGFGCNIMPGGNTRDNIRFAIQSTAQYADCSYEYTVTGWKKISGRYEYLMPGSSKYNVSLPDKMSGYRMSGCFSEGDIVILRSLLLDDRPVPAEVLFPLLAFVFLSPLNHFLREAECEPKTVMALVGRTGSKKSSVTALMLSFFGKFASTSLPMSFRDTANSIMHHAFQLKDVLTCIDDFHPGGKNDEYSMTDTMQKVLRAYGDRIGRGRLNQKAESTVMRKPQGNVIVTAEFSPDVGESGNARCFTLEMDRDSTDSGVLSRYQTYASEGRLSACMFAYTEWIRTNYLCDDRAEEDFIKSLRDKFVSYRDFYISEFNSRGIGFHPRMPEDCAVLKTGFCYMLDFLCESGCLSSAGKENCILIFDTIMTENAGSRSSVMEKDKPAVKFILKLSALLDSGRGILLPRDSDATEKNQLGYYDGDNYYLFKSMAHKAVKNLCMQQGESFSISEDALLKALDTEGYVCRGKDQITKTARYGTQNKTKHFLIIPKERFSSVTERFG